MIIKATDCFVDITDRRKIRPEDLPKAGRLVALNEHYSVKPGNTTLITGYPGSGKSYFVLNMQVSLSVQYGWKHLLYTPEMGEAADIFLTIVEIISGVRSWRLDDRNIADLLPWIAEHFDIYEPVATPTMDAYCKLVKENKGNYNTFSIDNLNDLSHTMPGGTQDIYWEQQMVCFNQTAKASGMHGFLVAHPRNPAPDELSQPPSPDKIKGGSAFWSKGQNILSIMAQGDVLTIGMLKAKPRIAGKRGSFEIRADFDRNTYYQYHVGGPLYMFDQAQHITPTQTTAF